MSKLVLAATAALAMGLVAQPASATWGGWKPKPRPTNPTPPPTTSTGGSSGSVQVPEPSDFALFGGGVIGLAVGRRLSKAKKQKQG